MNWKRIHHTPVANITMAIYFIVVCFAFRMDVTDVMLVIFVQTISWIFMIPLLVLIRKGCMKMGLSTWPRRMIMLIPVIAFSLAILPFPHRQARSFLKHGMAGEIPEKLKIVDYEGNSGLFADFGWIGIKCEPASLKSILESDAFERKFEPQFNGWKNREFQQGLEEYIQTDRDKWIQYYRSGANGGPRTCIITTDETYSWARINYSAGS